LHGSCTGHHHNAEGSALSEDLGQHSGSVSTDVQVGVCREHGQFVDDQHVERVPKRRLVDTGDAGHFATAIVDDSARACQDAQRFDRLGGHARAHGHLDSSFEVDAPQSHLVACHCVR
jgi:hypothetical protein